MAGFLFELLNFQKDLVFDLNFQIWSISEDFDLCY